MKLWLKMRTDLNLKWCEFKYENLVQEPETQIRHVLNFLDVEFDSRVLDFPENVKSKVVRSPTYHAVARPVYKTAIGRWRNYATKFKEVEHILQPFVEAFEY